MLREMGQGGGGGGAGGGGGGGVSVAVLLCASVGNLYFVLFLPHRSLFWCLGKAVLHEFSFSHGYLHLYCYNPTIGMMPGTYSVQIVHVIPSVSLSVHMLDLG